jgi:hypothetical protein
MTNVYIGGVPFLTLGHRDGRFVRSAGLFAFVRRERGGRFTVLHFEMTEAINRSARPGHARWDWCAGEGLNALMVHLAGRAAVVPAGVEPGVDTVVWHPGARVVFPTVKRDADALAAGSGAASIG